MGLGFARGKYVRALAAVYTSLFLVRVAFGVSLVTLPLYVAGDDTSFSLVVTTSPLLELITIVFAGVLIDKYGRKGVLLAGLAIAAVSLYGLALTRSAALLALVNAFHGIASALILVTTLAVIATYTPPHRRGREMGIFNFTNIFGLAAGYVVGFLLVDVFRSQLEYTFVVAGALATGGLLFANRMIHLPEREAPRLDDTGRPSLRELVRAATNGRVLLLTAPWLIVFMLVGAFLTFLSRVTAATLKISGGQTALFVLGVGGLVIVGQLFWGRLADRHGRESIMLVGAAGFTVLMGVIAFAFFQTPATLALQPPEPFTVAENVTGDATAPAPGDAPARIDRMVPAQGPAGTRVRFEGAGLKGAMSVTFTGASATFLVINDTALEATVPAGAQTGSVFIETSTPPTIVLQNVMSHSVILAILVFITLAFAPAGLAAIADEAKEGAQGTTMSAYGLTLSLGFIIGPPVLAFVSDTWHGPGTVLYFATLAGLLLLLVVVRFVQSRRRTIHA
jgi:MFS family permease